MKITVDLSPNEIFKLGKLTDNDFANGWNTLVHTHDTLTFAIHRLIEISECISECECEDCDLDD
jgi:hypothetical protein